MRLTARDANKNMFNKNLMPEILDKDLTIEEAIFLQDEAEIIAENQMEYASDEARYVESLAEDMFGIN